MNIVLMGPQGSGKTTQAKLLAQKLNLPLVVVGDMLRQMAKENNDEGKEIKEVQKRGELIPDGQTIAIVSARLSGPDCERGFVLDGFPRNLEQAQGLDKKVDKVFYLKVTDEVGIARLLSRGRGDDTKEAIATRLAIYHQETEPVLEFYSKQGVLEEINGEATIEEIFQEISKKVGVD